MGAPGAKSAVFLLRNGINVSIRNSTAAMGTRVLLDARHVSGKRLLMNNDLSGAGTVLKNDAKQFTLRGNYLGKPTPATVEH